MKKSSHLSGVRCPCRDCYTIFHAEHGILISAPLPLDHCSGLLKLFNELYGYDILDGLIAEKTKSAFAITTKEKSDTWRKELKIEEKEIHE